MIQRAPKHKAHTLSRATEMERAERQRVWRIRHSRRMSAFARRFRTAHPLCCDPFGEHEKDGVSRLTNQMHHVKPLEAHPELAFVEDNCRPLCTGCHARIEAMERRGLSTEALFAS